MTRAARESPYTAHMVSPEQKSPAPVASPAFTSADPTQWWRMWWRSLSPTRQDRLAALAPLVSVALFMAAIIAAFWYLRAEEVDRGEQALKRDVEYAQQRMRLRLLERQEQVMRIARDLSYGDIGTVEFGNRAEVLVTQYPELQVLTWVDRDGRIITSYAAPTVPREQLRMPAERLGNDSAGESFQQVKDSYQSVYHQPVVVPGQNPPLLQFHAPVMGTSSFGGTVMAEYSVDSLMRYATPSELLARYAITMTDAQGVLIAGTPLKRPHTAEHWYQIAKPEASEYQIPISPVGNSLQIKGQAYSTSLSMVGNGMFWLVASLSMMTAWLLLGTWRHTRKRLRAQEALVAETNFRRAMENSLLTGMRALDMQGRITYVNAAFCQMTGWSESELVGQRPPYSYWAESDYDYLHSKLNDELSGKTLQGGFQVRVRRKNGSMFDARLYISPLIDARGQQTGWMSSMTDITESKRIRDQLAASHDRFTIVLEALDASVSVAPLGSAELLFANKLYRQWFGSQTTGHLQLVQQAGLPAERSETVDDEDGLMGFPTDPLTSASSNNAEIYVGELGKWLEVRSRYLSWVDGRLAQMVIATDITQRRLAEEQAARQAEQAQSASRLITMGEMASSVAHELNQPLTAISNYSSGMLTRLANGTLTEDQMRFALEKTAHQAQRAGQIIQRIRSFVKRSEPNRTLAHVESIVEEALELANIEMRRRNVRLSHFVAARIPPVLADTILIEQVLINLIKNAGESIDQAQRTTAQRLVELRVVPKEVEGQLGVEFSVQDSGKGLAPEVQERLFEAFFSTKNEGMGIGLNLCRSIVESHDGRMAAENLYNGSEVVGCRFSFWIPLATPQEKGDNLSTVINPNTRNPA
ncbi:Sensor protein fixL [Comamonas aquatica]|uniref:histidine kinase n=2 Tax=Comamonas aquatica TaxID=225991 RepID=A0AA35D6Z2_9BURK|nr:Sensor protein fixL [Comamonas aquatica]CAB5688270.1 Sensor protein fixL [Comamonas aquatica]CAC9215129.1 Sensor protein fixL [Comamonas aquatica]CAC9685320.1 Sensor protein fixL [Comamonas aquatica]